MDKNNEVHTVLNQRPRTLAYAASGTPINAQVTMRPFKPATGLSLVLRDAQAFGRIASQQAPRTSCQQCLTFNFFFDGTGNNLDADIGSFQMSNVAKLYLSRLPDDEVVGRYSFYIPGLGTYFKEIGDDGNTILGKGMGHMGQERINWAFKQFDTVLKAAEARAMNPTNKIRHIRVSVFGFSRGATAARAFVRDLAIRCQASGSGMVLKPNQYPIEVVFLGLFDTVASVGLPMSANTTPKLRSAGMLGSRVATAQRANAVKVNNQYENTPTDADYSLSGIAFGAPGADPAPGIYDGHASWADGLHVPAPLLVKQCVHIVAGHEMRNSFPLDSVLNGQHYPDNTLEMVYPGVHSDVGGGYQPGEGGKGEKQGDLLSVYPLRTMHQLAREAGVPLMDLSRLKHHPNSAIPEAFALDSDGVARFDKLLGYVNAYMQAVGGGREIGGEFLAHMRLYFRWRMQKIKKNQQNKSAGRKTDESVKIDINEGEFSKSRIALTSSMVTTKKAWDEAERVHYQRCSEATSVRQRAAHTGEPINMQPYEARIRAADDERKLRQDAYLREKAKLDTFANDSALVSEIDAYDERLIKDAQQILQMLNSNPKLKLRPHYQHLVEAYQDEFVLNKGLRDERIIAFFDQYVHDSLAGFALDSTLPSDPRVIYVGGDNKLRFAQQENTNNSVAA